MIALRPLPQERIDFINEDDARLRFPGETEQTSYQFVGFAIPFIGKHRGCDVDKSSPRLLG